MPKNKVRISTACVLSSAKDNWVDGVGAEMRKIWMSFTLASASLSMVVGVGVPAALAAYDPDSLIPTGSFDNPCANTTSTSTNQQPCQTDNGGISVFMQTTVSTHMKGRIRESLDKNYDPIAELSITYVSAPVYSGSGETDIIYQQADLPGTLLGFYWCNDAVNGSTYKCDQGYVRFTTTVQYERWALVCHETGHALGLMHGSESSPVTNNSSSKLGCLRTPFDEEYRSLGPNNVTQLKDTY